MKIPTKFKLFGQTITISFAPEEFTDKDGRYGTASYRLNQIKLRPSTSTHPIDDTQMGAYFCHELMHFILYHAGASYSGKSDYMHQDEGFVDTCGELLHQALTSFEGNIND